MLVNTTRAARRCRRGRRRAARWAGGRKTSPWTCFQPDSSSSWSRSSRSPLARVLGVVLAQRAHQDQRDDARQEDDHHERVEDGEPVDLVLEEVVVEVAVVAVVAPPKGARGSCTSPGGCCTGPPCSPRGSRGRPRRTCDRSSSARAGTAHASRSTNNAPATGAAPGSPARRGGGWRADIALARQTRVRRRRRASETSARSLCDSSSDRALLSFFETFTEEVRRSRFQRNGPKKNFTCHLSFSLERATRTSAPRPLCVVSHHARWHRPPCSAPRPLVCCLAGESPARASPGDASAPPPPPPRSMSPAWRRGRTIG